MERREQQEHRRKVIAPRGSRVVHNLNEPPSTPNKQSKVNYNLSKNKWLAIYKCSLKTLEFSFQPGYYF